MIYILKLGLKESCAVGGRVQRAIVKIVREREREREREGERERKRETDTAME